ncbi:MAG: NADH-quinone oxidoreductase subunit C [Thermoanaerobaculales bacterium]|nr:NADH-quinone oxidoreductase subunit C [Thermoanaerobaculales bacterium]
MSDDKPVNPPEEKPPTEGTAADGAAPPAEAKQPLSDEEKAAKIAAAKARAAEKKAGAAAAAAEPEAPKQPWEEKPVPPDHADAADDADAVALAAELPGAVLAADRFAGEVTLSVPAARIAEICAFLKAGRGFRFLVDLTAVDWPERAEGRFDLIYWLHRHDDSKRLRLRAALADETPVASVVGVWKTADWMEREAYDMFGIVFEGHPGLERILTWEGFNGHPLRKDFPVEGIDTGAAIYPDVYPPGGGPPPEGAGDEEGGSA